MATPSAQPSALVTRLQLLLLRLWVTLRSPLITAVALIVLTLVVLIGVTLPQRPAAETDLNSWLATLPPAYQLSGNTLFALGLSRVFHTAWFWLPLGVLLLNSLLALAEFAPRSWRRFRHRPADITWQYPLIRRVEKSARLPANPDDHLAVLAAHLQNAGFSTSPFESENERAISATRRPWCWLTPASFYGGTVLLIVAVLLTFYSLKTEQLVIWPTAPVSSQLFDSHVALYKVENDRAIVIFTPDDADRPTLALFLIPYVPAFFQQTFIWPTSLEPVLTVEARDENGEQRRLMPVQTDLSPGSRLSLPLDQPDSPLYFLIPTADLAFQIIPAETGETFQVQVRRGNETDGGESFAAQPGESFTVDNITLDLSRQYKIQFIARRDIGLPLLLLSLLVMLVSVLLLALLPPWQLWIIPEVKGRGGQLYGVAESPGRAGSAANLLRLLLEPADSPGNSDHSQVSASTNAE
jgi:hypothetical protein